MAYKFIVLSAVLAVANAGLLAAPAVAHYPAVRPLTYATSVVPKVATPLAYAHPAIHRPLAYASPIAKVAVPALAKVAVPAEYDANPQYHYAYSVADAITGDNKHQEESRDGDVVKGSYSLVEADGTRRIVEYTADPINGFNAVVHKEGVAVQKAVVAAPAYAKVAAPLAYAAPIARAYHASPIVHATPYAKVVSPLAYHG